FQSLCQRVVIWPGERAGGVGGSEGDPPGSQAEAARVQLLHLRGEGSLVRRLTGIERDRAAIGGEHLKGLDLAAPCEVGSVRQDEAVEEAVGSPGGGIGASAAGATDVLDDPQGSIGVDLHALEPTAADESLQVADGGR